MGNFVNQKEDYDKKKKKIEEINRQLWNIHDQMNEILFGTRINTRWNICRTMFASNWHLT